MSPEPRPENLHAAPLGRALSVATKLTFATLAVLLLVSALLYSQLMRHEQKQLISAKANAAEMVSDLFAISLSAALDFGDMEAVETQLRNLKSNHEIVYGAVWSRSSDVPLGVFGSSFVPVEGRATRPGLQVFSDRLEVARIVLGPVGPVGRALLVFSLAQENVAFAASRTRFFWLAMLMAGGTASVLITIARRQVVLPLRAVVAGLARIERGEHELSIDVRSNDEIGKVARAFNTMAAAILDRERRLDAARRSLRDLFDGMRQSIFAFGPDGRVIGEVSRQATLLFGHELEGKAVAELLYSADDAHDIDPRAFEEWKQAVFSVEPDRWSELAQLAPEEVTIQVRERGAVPLELEFRALIGNGKIERVMLLATDVSDKRRLEQAVRTQEQEHTRQLSLMRRLIAGGAQVFVDFISAGHRRLLRSESIVLASEVLLRSSDIDELFRHAHTLKAEAKAFDLRDLEAVCRELEDDLDALRSAARGDGAAMSAPACGGLLDKIGRARQALDHGRELFVAASPSGRALLDQVTVQRAELDELVQLIGSRPDALGRLAQRLAARSFGESTANLIDMVPAWAEGEGKRASLQVEGREVKVSVDLAAALAGVLTHLARNALAHGIETVAVREQLGKPAAGLIRIVAKDSSAGPIIEVEDDGGGLDAARIAERAAGLPDTSAAGTACELVFLPGLTTANREHDLAGRGIGLYAVRAELAQVGYEIVVTSEPGRLTRFVLSPTMGGGQS